MKPPALVLLNGAAHGGRGGARFARIRGVLDEVCEPRVVPLEPAGDWPEQVERALREGVRFYVAAGGDGTVHALVNALDERRGAVSLEELWLGAIGLGSSNDFHKPPARVVDGVPVRLRRDRGAPRDLVRARWESGDRLFAVSASLGFTARANAAFNRGGPVLGRLKRLSTGAAIAWAVVTTLARHRTLVGQLAVDGEARQVAVANLGLLKTPWVSGSFRTDTPIAEADGRVAVNLLDGLGRLGLVRALLGLLRGRFEGGHGATAWRARRVELELEEAAELELDGELYSARRLHFEVLQEAIRTCA